MPSFNGTGTVTVIGSYDDSSTTTIPSELINYVRSTKLTDGTGANKADLFYSTRAQHTGTVSYDLVSVLVDRFGNAMTYVELKLILLVNRSTTTGDLLIMQGNLMSVFLNGTSPTEDVGPGGVSYRTSPIDGWATLVGASNDVLTINAASNTISYDLFLIGASA